MYYGSIVFLCVRVWKRARFCYAFAFTVCVLVCMRYNIVCVCDLCYDVISGCVSVWAPSCPVRGQNNLAEEEAFDKILNSHSLSCSAQLPAAYATLNQHSEILNILLKPTLRRRLSWLCLEDYKRGYALWIEMGNSCSCLSKETITGSYFYNFKITLTIGIIPQNMCRPPTPWSIFIISLNRGFKARA